MLAANIWVGIDTGGTFTDLVAVDAAGDIIATCKVPTTPSDRSVGIAASVSQLIDQHGIAPDAIAAVMHGTTVATNALLERRVARTALLITRGFRDVLRIARQDRPSLYDPTVRRPEPLVPRELTFEVDERVLWDGSVQLALTARESARIVGLMRDASVEAVAIGLLHSYANPEHEVALKSAVAQAFPHVPITASAELLPRLGEYERVSTAVVNAALAPVIDRYLGQLRGRLRSLGVTAPIYVMQSNGGLGNVASVAGRAVQTILSGPAGGVAAGRATGRRASKPHLMSVDMGGTSFDISLMPDRQMLLSSESEIDRIPISTPSVRIHTLGAGGGSIAWIDAGGALRVGPTSAGADPGPAAYGRGGSEPTVTDANLLLGRLGASLLAGALTLDRALAEAAIRTRIAEPLAISTEEAALGIIRVVNADMARGMRAMSIGRGYRPDETTLVAFGGAGPLHAAELAEIVGMTEVLIPPTPGATSAQGVVFADLAIEASIPVLTLLGEISAPGLRMRLDQVVEKARALLIREGAPPDAVRVRSVAALAYDGQAHDIDVAIESEDSAADLTARFTEAHRARYGYVRSEAVRLTSLRSTAAATVGPRGGVHFTETVGALVATRPRATRSVRFADAWHEAAVVWRVDIPLGGFVEGPAIIEQLDSTMVVPPGRVAERIADRILVMRPQEKRQ